MLALSIVQLLIEIENLGKSLADCEHALVILAAENLFEVRLQSLDVAQLLCYLVR